MNVVQIYMFCSCFLLGLAVSESVEIQQEFYDLKSQVQTLLEHRDQDLQVIEFLVTERLKDRAKLAELTNSIEDYRDDISQLVKVNTLQEAKITALENKVAEILKQAANDRKLTEELQKTTDSCDDSRGDTLDADENVEAANVDDSGLMKDGDYIEIPEYNKTVAILNTGKVVSNRIQKRLDPPSGGIISYPAFTACVSSGTDISLGRLQTVIFDHVLTNTGGDYHGTTGIFTAPMDGLYVFHLSFMVLPGKSLYLHITKDGQNLDNVYNEADVDVTANSVSETWVLDLQKGSEVWIAADNPGDIHGYCHSHFTGFLLHSPNWN